MSTQNSTPGAQRQGSVALLFDRAEKMGLQPEWITLNGLFLIQTNTGERFINHERSSLNSHISISVTRNKYSTRLVLGRHKLPNIPYIRTASRLDAVKFFMRHGTIIAKPVKGSMSRGIIIIRDESQLLVLNLFDYILEKYIPGREMRYLVLAGRVIGVHESRYGDSVAYDRLLERISYEESDWDPELVNLSLKVAGILELSFAAVDYMIDDQDQAHILEVNSCPGMKWFHAPSQGPSVDVAQMFLKEMLKP
jgi:glutathione synthase/RimK-type ligase-like ATP-grasp enzyme